MGTPKDSQKTRGKIIEAAGRLFSQKGFKGVTVREIAKNAETHLGALNYHFRSKEALYREVLLEACRKSAFSEEDQNNLLGLAPREALRMIIQESLKKYRKKGASNWQSAIMTRECWEPSNMFSEIAKTFFSPQADFITKIIGKIVEQPPESHTVRFGVVVLIGLLETLGLYEHFIQAVAPGLLEDCHQKDWMENRIVHLTLEAADPSYESDPAHHKHENQGGTYER